MADDLWINNAQVKLIEASSNSILNFFNVGQGKYFPVSNESPEDLENYLTYLIKPGEIYRLVVVHDMDSIVAETSVPAEMNIRPASLGIMFAQTVMCYRQIL